VILASGRTRPFIALSFQAVSPTNVNLRITGPASPVIQPVLIVAADAKLDFFFKDVREHRYYTNRTGGSWGAWTELEIEPVPPALRVGDSVRISMEGAWDSFTPIVCEAEPFEARNRFTGSTSSVDIYNRLKWKNP
jgi:hypothetical protein